MARSLRVVTPSCAVHVVNRGNERRRLFDRPCDYDDFLALLDRAARRRPVRLIGYALMPNHWHLVLWPEAARDLSQFLHHLTTLHASRFRYLAGTTGAGHVYQGRFRSTSVDSETHYLNTLLYVEANPLRARFVARAEDWPWTSLAERRGRHERIVEGPVALPAVDAWTALVNICGSEPVGGPGASEAADTTRKSGASQNGV